MLIDTETRLLLAREHQARLARDATRAPRLVRARPERPPKTRRRPLLLKAPAKLSWHW